MSKSNIGWTDYTWNPYLWRCTPVSPGCKNCYMFTQARNRKQEPNARISGMGERFDRALKELHGFKDGSVIFVNSMSDTYHEEAPLEWIQRIHRIAVGHPQFTFLLLTKRPKRALELSPRLEWPPNLWVGTSVESHEYLHRLDSLLEIPAAGHFLSAEPLLNPIVAGIYDYIESLDWIIVGGESGANRRPFDRKWARDIRDVCQEFGVPFMFKQGSAFKPGQDRDLDGRVWDETPEFPTTKGSLAVQSAQLRLF